jgi:hypothetical protein
MNFLEGREVLDSDYHRDTTLSYERFPALIPRVLCGVSRSTSAARAATAASGLSLVAVGQWPGLARLRVARHRTGYRLYEAEDPGSAMTDATP